MKKEIVYISAKWCMPCKQMASLMNEIEANYSDKVTIIKIDADEKSDKLMELGVSSVPTFLLYKDGVQVKKVVGVQNKMFFTNFINS
jgi:thioredoxin 1